MPLTHSPTDRGIISRYRHRLDLPERGQVISLHEGQTPLIHAPRLEAALGRGSRVFIKYEGLNPTGSFKDRGMTMAITHAAARGVKAVICASTGNTSASAAAYAARAGLLCVVLLPAGKITRGKLAQAWVYGAKILSIRGNFDDALNIVREMGQRDEFEIVNSINPYRIEGQKTAAFEIVEDLGDAPQLHALPVGNAGNITAYWKGYTEDVNDGRATRRPLMLGMQAAGAAPIYFGHDISHPETVATAIRIGAPASREGAVNALRQSGGDVDIVSDDEILTAQTWLAANEGIFVEPASAAGVAGLLKAVREPDSRAGKLLRQLPEEATVVCTVTGNGLKDVDVVLKGDPLITECDARVDDVLRRLSL